MRKYSRLRRLFSRRVFLSLFPFLLSLSFVFEDSVQCHLELSSLFQQIFTTRLVYRDLKQTREDAAARVELNFNKDADGELLGMSILFMWFCYCEGWRMIISPFFTGLQSLVEAWWHKVKKYLNQNEDSCVGTMCDDLKELNISTPGLSVTVRRFAHTEKETKRLIKPNFSQGISNINKKVDNGVW